MKIRSEDHIEKVDNIENYYPKPNFVLLEQITSNSIKKIGDTEIVFPETARVGKVAARYSVRVALVKAVPKEFVFRKEGRHASRWRTEIEVKPGDLVWCSHTAFKNSEQFERDGTIYYAADYQDLVLRKRGEEITPLNGYVLVEKIEEEVSKLIFVPRKKTQRAVVTHVGSPVHYYDERFSHAEVSVGDEIIYSPVAIHRLEEDIWRILPKIWYLQSKNILATYEKSP